MGGAGSIDSPEASTPASVDSVSVTALVTEHLKNPVGIDTPVPRLSWALVSTERGQKQTAYEIVAAIDGAPVWDSGKVVSDQQSHVPFGGPRLGSGERVTWKVRIWNVRGEPSAYSAEAFFEMGLLAPNDWKGKWIAATEQLSTPPPPAPVFRRTFSVGKTVRRARAYISGVGYSELYVNGNKIGDHVLDPGYTRFDRRLLYVTHDVTAALQKGNNTIGVILGNGFLNQHAADEWGFKNAPWRVTPRLLLQVVVQYTDGATDTLVSDENWTVGTGPIVFDGIRNGESYDARLEKAGWSTPEFLEDATFKPALAVKSPGGVLSAQMIPQKVMGSLPVKAITQPKPGVFIVDFGQNTAGWAKLTVSGPAGTKVQMRYGEKLDVNGNLDNGVIGQYVTEEGFQTDNYTLKGSGTETWQARFAYSGFQYVEVIGFPGTPTSANFEAQVVHTAFEQIGSFSSSNDLLNRIYAATLWSYKANFQSIPTDCPHREKNGWMGDAHIGAEQAMLNFGNAAGYTKWIRDVRDEMRPTGELPGIVPTSGFGYVWGNGPGWDSALLLIPWYLYQYTGDSQLMTASYEHFKRYVDYVGTRDYMASNPSGWLGDWIHPDDANTPEAVMHAGYHVTDARITAATARLLGKTDEATKYDAVANKVKQDFNSKFFDKANAVVSNGTQTAFATALYQGLLADADVPRVTDNLLAAITAKNDHLDTGFLGTKYLPWALTDTGHADVFYKIATKTDSPSWGNWLRQGATTLWEDWPGDASRNHIFLGDISAWFIRGLAGINPDPDGPGFAKIIIRPQVVGDLTAASATTDTLRGKVASAWKLEGDKLTLDVTIPVNSSATVFVPAATRDSVTADGATFVRSDTGRQVFTVASGTYEFSVAGVSH